MSDSIREYIKVRNYIPPDICGTLVESISMEKWSMHQWTSYNDVVPKDVVPAVDTLTELSVLGASEVHNATLMPYIFNALQDYIHSFPEYPASTDWCKYGCSVRFNRYDINTLMKIHYDHITSLFDGERRGIPVLSVVGLLNDNYQGGEFVLFKDHKIELKVGDILVFPSNFMYPHRVDQITKGTRYSFVSWAW